MYKTSFKNFNFLFVVKSKLQQIKKRSILKHRQYTCNSYVELLKIILLSSAFIIYFVCLKLYFKIPLNKKFLVKISGISLAGAVNQRKN